MLVYDNTDNSYLHYVSVFTYVIDVKFEYFASQVNTNFGIHGLNFTVTVVAT